MPEYRYQAIDKRGRNRHGSMPAQDETDLQQKLKVLGLWLTEAVMRQPALSATTAPKSKVSSMRLRGKRQRRELIDFCTLMTFQIRVGIPRVKGKSAGVMSCDDAASTWNGMVNTNRPPATRIRNISAKALCRGGTTPR